MSVIAAVEVHYEGCRFRSRLEARFAVFFDHLGIRWQYEPERWQLVSERLTYQPDFWLPGIEAYFEVKGLWDYSVRKPSALAIASGEMVYLAVGGFPSQRQLRSRGWWDDELKCGVKAVSPGYDWDDWVPSASAAVFVACEAARSARFDGSDGTWRPRLAA